MALPARRPGGFHRLRAPDVRRSRPTGPDGGQCSSSGRADAVLGDGRAPGAGDHLRGAGGGLSMDAAAPIERRPHSLWSLRRYVRFNPGRMWAIVLLLVARSIVLLA